MINNYTNRNVTLCSVRVRGLFITDPKKYYNHHKSTNRMLFYTELSEDRPAA